MPASTVQEGPLDPKFTLGNVLTIITTVLMVGLAVGRMEARANSQDQAIADMRAEQKDVNRTIQTQALAIQKLADALDGWQNHRAGPFRPVRGN